MLTKMKPPKKKIKKVKKVKDCWLEVTNGAITRISFEKSDLVFIGTFSYKIGRKTHMAPIFETNIIKAKLSYTIPEYLTKIK